MEEKIMTMDRYEAIGNDVVDVENGEVVAHSYDFISAKSKAEKMNHGHMAHECGADDSGYDSSYYDWN